jgi:uncharacterized protein (UPF0276 family)
MIRVGVPISEATLALAEAGHLDVDYIVYYAQAGLKEMQEYIKFKPLFLHDLPEPFWLNYEDPFVDSVMTEARAMLDLAKSPWLSTGIGASAEPQAHRDGPYREADDKDLQSRQTVIGNIVKHGKRLKAWAGVPLLLENYNYHRTNAYEYICEPELFTQLLDEIDCGMLLDLAHARISAHNMGWSSAESYLEALPLHKAREVHVTRPGWQGDQRVDLHQPLLPEDLPLLGWVLDHAPIEAVTVEIEHTIDEATLADQIALMRQFLKDR